MNETEMVPPKSARPAHVAIIMDGNGRWALERGLRRLDGHRKGARVVREITTFSRELEIRYLTLYSFSVQNWRRPADEVTGLMKLLEEFCRDERDSLMEHDIRLHTIGNLGRLPGPTRRAVESAITATAANHTMTLTLALDYGGREEILRAAQRIAEAVVDGQIRADEVNEQAFSNYLHDSTLPDPDVVIRTSGEKRVSNFLLWQLAYAELFFTDTYWPDFTRREFAAALREYASRKRRFGATQEQIEAGIDLLEPMRASDRRAV